MRILALLLAALLLAGCRVVFVPAPVDTSALALPAPTPAPDEAVATFLELYDALDAPYLAMYAQLDVPAWDDPEWRAELARTAAAWRSAIEALQEAEQPAGERWAAAWPVLQEGLAEYHYAAGAVENAANANAPALMEPARARLVNGVNLVTEAMRILGED